MTINESNNKNNYSTKMKRGNNNKRNRYKITSIVEAFCLFIFIIECLIISSEYNDILKEYNILEEKYYVDTSALNTEIDLLNKQIEKLSNK